MSQGWNVDATADLITFLEAPDVGVGNIVVKQFAAGAMGGTNAWALGAWSNFYGWPAETEFWGNRLLFARTKTDPQTMWGSCDDDYRNFGKSTPIVDSDALNETLNTRQVNAIVDMVPMDRLIVLSTGGAFLIKGDQDDVVSPVTIQSKPQSMLGAADVQSCVIGDTAIFVKQQGQHVHDIGYKFEQDGYRPTDLSVWADHLVESRTILRMQWMEAPWSVLWFLRDDGLTIGCTYLPEQNVIGWHQHPTDGKDIDVCCLPSQQQTETYFLCARQLGGTTRLCIEQLAPSVVADPRDWFYVDCGLQYDGRNTTDTTLTLSGGDVWDDSEDLTVTASALTGINGDAGFNADDVGDGFQVSIDVLETDPTTGDQATVAYSVRVQISAILSPTGCTVVAVGTVPAALRDAATAAWVFQRTKVFGADHLAGRKVAILADASVEAQQVVAVDGSITLPGPRGVVNIGLPYTAVLETLEVNVPGGAPLRGEKKLMTHVQLLVRNTRGIKVGPDLDDLEVYATRESEDWSEATQAVTGLITIPKPAEWGENAGTLVVVSPDPLPAEILAITPKLIASPT